MKAPTFRMKPTHCPVCDYTVSAATPANGGSRAPRPGDLTVCFQCAAFLQFSDDEGLRELPDEEFNALPEQARADLRDARTMITQFLAQEARWQRPN